MKTYKFHKIMIIAFFGVGTIQPVRACDFPPKELLERSPGEYLEFHGKYANEWWGYSVVIPASTVGYDVADQPNHHGFGLILGDRQQGYINVYAEANSLEYKGARDRVDDLLSYLRQDGKKIIASRTIHSHLGGLNAIRLSVTYMCQESSERYRMVSMVALSPGKDVMYEVTLYSAASRYPSDCVVLEKVLKTWKYIGR